MAKLEAFIIDRKCENCDEIAFYTRASNRDQGLKDDVAFCPNCYEICVSDLKRYS